MIRRILPIFLFILIMGCAEQKFEKRDYSLEDSREIAELFVLNSPTYSFNGKNLELLDSNILRCENCFIFVFKFTSAYAGYGDRAGQVPVELEKEYFIDVIVHKGEVVQSTVNNEWNELLQKNLVAYEVIDGEKIERIPTYYCSQPRPEVCTQEHDPVCGSDNNDYSNGCSACSKKSVKWYTKGTCDLGFQQRVVRDFNAGKVTKDSGPVLVVVAWNLLE